MNICEFQSYVPTPNEKHLGIVTVKMYGKIIIRMKWVQKKDGVGCFASPPSYKITDAEGERYIPAVMIDSRSEQEEMENVIRKGINASKNKVSNPRSALSTPEDDPSGEPPF